MKITKKGNLKISMYEMAEILAKVSGKFVVKNCENHEMLNVKAAEYSQLGAALLLELFSRKETADE